MKVEIKNKKRELLAVVDTEKNFLNFTEIGLRSNLKELYEGALKNGVKFKEQQITGEGKDEVRTWQDKVIKNDDPGFLSVFAASLRREGFVIGQDSYLAKIREEMKKYPQDDEYIKELYSKIDSMSNLELTYLLDLLEK